MRQYSKAQIDHFLNSEILNAALDSLEDKFTRHMKSAETFEQSKPYWDLSKALKELRRELKAIGNTHEQS